MNDNITHTGSVELDVSDVVREQLATVLQSTMLPVVIRIGDRKCMVIVLPPEERQDLAFTSDVKEANILHKPKHGELKLMLEKIASELKIKDGETVPSKQVHWITNELRKRGLDVNSETVRAKLRTLGYYTERNM